MWTNDQAHRRSVAVSGAAPLGKQFVIFRMSTYPNPKKTAFNLRGYRTIIGTNTNRPNFAYFFELQRRVGVIGF